MLGIDPSTLYRKLSRYEEQPAAGVSRRVLAVLAAPLRPLRRRRPLLRGGLEPVSRLFVGHDAYAQILTLVIFLGGMGHRRAAGEPPLARLRDPLFGYAIVEALIGVLGSPSTT